jgi:hypothetical protein
MKILAVIVLTGLSLSAAARGSGGHAGGSGYSGRYGPAHSFSYSPCVHPACFAKHPDGRFLHPNTGGMRRRRV